MTQTLLAQNQDFEYLIKTVLDTQDDDLLTTVLAQNNITTIHQILTMTSHVIDLMKYRETTDRTDIDKPVPLVITAIFYIIKAWNQHLISTHNLTKVDWLDKTIVNAETYDIYRVSTYDPDIPIPTTSDKVLNKPPANSHPVTKQQHSVAIYDRRNIASHICNQQRYVNENKLLYNQDDSLPHEDDFKDVADDHYFGSYGVPRATTTPRAPLRRRRPYLKREIWSTLSRADQLVWDQLSDFVKWSIISGNRQQVQQPSQHPSPVKSMQADLSQCENKEVKDETARNEKDQHEQEHLNHIIINAAKTNKVLPPSDIRMLLSSTDDTDIPNIPKSTNIIKPKRKINLHEPLYTTLQHDHRSVRIRGALIDQGANGGLVGSDVHMHQYDHIPNDKTIHSCIQVDRPIKIHWRTPFEKLHGNTVYYKHD